MGINNYAPRTGRILDENDNLVNEANFISDVWDPINHCMKTSTSIIDGTIVTPIAPLSVSQQQGFTYDILPYLVVAVRDNTIYGIDGSNRVYRSTDGGTTWSAALIAFSGVAINTGHLTSTGVLLLFMSDGSIRRSTDGVNFTTAKTGIVPPLVNGVDSNGNIVFFGEYTSNGSTSANVWTSTDGGLNWTSTLNLLTPSQANHFHSARYCRESSLYFNTYGDTNAGIYSSADANTWTVRGTGINYRMVGLSMVTNNVIVYGADSNNGLIYAGIYSNLDNTLRKIGIIPGHCLGIAGERNTLMLVTRPEITDQQGDSLNHIYVSYDAGRSWNVECCVTGQNGIIGILGPDRKGRFFVSCYNIDEAAAGINVTVRATPVAGYRKRLEPMVLSASRRSIKIPLFAANQIRVANTVVWATALPFTIFDPLIACKNTLDQAASIRVELPGCGGFMKYGATDLAISIAADTGGIVGTALTPNELHLNCLPAGTLIGAACTTLPTVGDLTMTLSGTVYMPDDHRNLDSILSGW